MTTESRCQSEKWPLTDPIKSPGLPAALGVRMSVKRQTSATRCGDDFVQHTAKRSVANTAAPTGNEHRHAASTNVKAATACRTLGLAVASAEQHDSLLTSLIARGRLGLPLLRRDYSRRPSRRPWPDAGHKSESSLYLASRPARCLPWSGVSGREDPSNAWRRD